MTGRPQDLLRRVFLEGRRPLFWIALCCFFLYAKTLAFRFTFFDDDALILNNLRFLGDPRNLLAAFRQAVSLGGEAAFYRPLLTVSFMLDALAGGASPAVYHFTNIALHAAASCLVFVLFERLGYGRRSAFFAALVFAVHPALSQAVAWIPGRNDTLLAVFVLASFIAFIDYLDGRGALSLFLHLLLFNLALYAKETALLAPLLCLLYAGLWRKGALPVRRWAGTAAGWAASAAAWYLMRSSAAAAPARGDLLASLPDIPLSLLQYLGKALFPFALSGFPVTRDTGPAYGIAALVALACALALTGRERLRRAFFGLLWFLLFLLPPFAFPVTFRLEHRLYLPVLGVFIALAEAALSRAPLLSRRMLAPAAVTVIVVFSGLTFVHSDIFVARLPFWENAVRTSPRSAAAHNGLGVRYLEYGEQGPAEQEFLRALRLDPGLVSAHVNLAVLYMGRGQREKAGRALDDALRLAPRAYIAWYDRGLLRYLQGDDDGARRCWEKALEIDPGYFPACRTLAVFHSLRGDRAAGDYLKRCEAVFKRPVTVPAGAALKDREWLCRFSLTD